MTQYKNSIFVFRRDLRLDDNTGFIEACRRSEHVCPVFILDPRQIEPHPYRSESALEFMVEALERLDESLQERGSRLLLVGGVVEDVIVDLVRRVGAHAVFLNGDVTPFSRGRDRAVQSRCAHASIAFHSYDDAMLNAPQSVMKSDGTPYIVFTPYYRRAATLPVRQPVPFDHTLSEPASDLSGVLQVAGLRESCGVAAAGRGATPVGRSAALDVLERMSHFSNYARVHDLPGEDGTTHLSACLKFGCVSPREVWYAVRDVLGSSHPLVRQMHWRDFFYQIAWHFPRVFGAAFREKYEAVVWDTNPEGFEAWCRGNTGFPLVDAGMRELNQTGYMHNRVRMVTASFLTKDLHIDWREGERYFARRLTDYDPAVNNGNWQWVASTGCDAQPWFRVFNPWLQQKRFDPDATYIRRWVPELRGVESTLIHNLWKDRPSGLEYPLPILDHHREAEETKRRFSVV